MATYSYRTRAGTSRDFEAENTAAALAALSGFSDADPRSGVQEVRGATPAPAPIQQPAQPERPPMTPLTSPEGAIDASLLAAQTPASLPEPEAPKVQTEYVGSLQAQADSARARLDTMLKQQRDEAQKSLDALKKEEKDILSRAEPLTDPFRQSLEQAERRRLSVDENFNANQKLIGELDALLSEGNALIAAASGRPVGLSVLNQRVSKTMQTVAARAGVVEAVINARNGQIAQAYTMIDRSVDAIAADRQDKINYYSTLLDLNGKGQLSLEGDIKEYAEMELNLAKEDVDRLQSTADYLKELMISPETAQFVADAGVTLSDSVEEIGKKMSAQAARQKAAEFEEYKARARFDQALAQSDPLYQLRLLRERKEIELLGEPSKKELQEEKSALLEKEASVIAAQNKIEAVDILSEHSGMKSRVGANIFTRGPRDLLGTAVRLPTLVIPGTQGTLVNAAKSSFTGEGQDFSGGIHKLVAGLSIDNLIEAKARGATFGALSDSEMRILSNAASAIADWEIKDGKGVGTGFWDIDEASFKRELTTIKNLTREAIVRSGGSLVNSDEAALLDEIFGASALDPANFYGGLNNK